MEQYGIDDLESKLFFPNDKTVVWLADGSLLFKVLLFLQLTIKSQPNTKNIKIVAELPSDRILANKEIDSEKLTLLLQELNSVFDYPTHLPRVRGIHMFS